MVTVKGGIATFTNLADNKAETITLQFTSSPVADAGDLEQHRGQPGGGEPVGDPHPAVTDCDGWCGLQHPAGGLCRGSVRQPRDRRQHHPGHGGFATRGLWPAPGDDDGDGHGWHRHLHQPGGQQGRDYHAPVHQRSGPDAGDLQQHRGQPGGGEPVGDSHSAVTDGDGRCGLQHAAGGLHRRSVRQHRDWRQHDPGHGGFAARGLWPAPGDDDGDGHGWHRHLHQLGGQQGRDDHAPLHRRSGPDRRRRPAASWSARRRRASW